MEENFNHVPVLLNECIEGLNIKPDGVYVDCTLGGGGHSGEIAKRLTTGRLISIDKDEDAIAYSEKRLEAYKDKITFVHDDFKNIESILKNLSVSSIDGVLADLGVSSYQIDVAERGFSYMKDAPLDMRMDRSQPFFGVRRGERIRRRKTAKNHFFLRRRKICEKHREKHRQRKRKVAGIDDGAVGKNYRIQRTRFEPLEIRKSVEAHFSGNPYRSERGTERAGHRGQDLRRSA